MWISKENTFDRVTYLGNLQLAMMAPWCSGYHCYTTSLNKVWTQVLHRIKSCSRRVRNSRWWGSLTMVPAGNKAKRLSSVNHTTKTIHHHHHQSSILNKDSVASFFFCNLFKFFKVAFLRNTPGRQVLIGSFALGNYIFKFSDNNVKCFQTWQWKLKIWCNIVLE